MKLISGNVYHLDPAKSDFRYFFKIDSDRISERIVNNEKIIYIASSLSTLDYCVAITQYGIREVEIDLIADIE